jgi:hypothetical protein
MMTRAATVQLALSKVGIAESPPGSNRVEFSRWYGLVGPWCAMFLSWVLAQAGNKSGYRFASTAASVAWARRQGRLIPVAQAQPGDVLVRLYTATTGHTGMATERPRDGTQVTVEGNTSGANDRDGGRVMVRRRSLSWWHYCIRIDYPTPPPGAPIVRPGPTYEDGTMQSHFVSLHGGGAHFDTKGNGYWDLPQFPFEHVVTVNPNVANPPEAGYSVPDVGWLRWGSGIRVVAEEGTAGHGLDVVVWTVGTQ